MKTFRDLLFYSAKKYGNSLAFKEKKGQTIREKSFKNLKYDCDSFSKNCLKYMPYKIKVALMGTSCYEWVVSYFGLINAGIIVVPIDVRLPACEIANQIEKGEIDNILYLDGYKNLALEVVSYSNVNVIIENAERYLKSTNIEQCDMKEEFLPSECCTIMFTSGTSGESKGVMLSQEGLLINAINCAERTGYSRENAQILSILPIFHIFCLSVDILWGIYSGTCTCICSTLGGLFKDVKDFKANRIAMVPMMLEYIYRRLKRMSINNSDKKEIVNTLFGTNDLIFTIGGAFLRSELREEIEKFGIIIKEQYGITENSCNLCTEHGCEVKKGSLGKILKDQEYKIVDEEIWVKGKTVMLGYYNDPVRTQEVVSNGWLKTGDLGFIDDDGYLFLKGRKKAQIILSSGENISPEQLENMILESDKVKEVVVYQEQDIIIAELYMGEIEVGGYLNYQLLGEKIIEEINSKNPMYKHIHHVRIRENPFEKTASMKIKRGTYLYKHE